jgi:hypothetical protein
LNGKNIHAALTHTFRNCTWHMLVHIQLQAHDS